MNRALRAIGLTLVAPLVLVAATLTSPSVFALLRDAPSPVVAPDSSSPRPLLRLVSTGDANPPPQPTGLAQSIQIDSTILMLTLSPGRAGANEATIMYFSAHPETTVEVDAVRLSYLEHPGVEFEATLSERHPGHIYCRDLVFPHPGRWRLEAFLRTQDGIQPAAFELTVGTAGPVATLR